jgi:hypothetical protein
MAVVPLLHKFAHLASRRRWLLCGALAALTCATLALRFVAFSRLASWFGASRQETPLQLSARHVLVARDIGWAVTAAAARLPWKAECLVQALAAALLTRTRRLPSTLYLGVAHGELGQLQAHAWLRCGPCIITGKAGHERFKPVASFRSRP